MNRVKMKRRMMRITRISRIMKSEEEFDNEKEVEDTEKK